MWNMERQSNSYEYTPKNFVCRVIVTSMFGIGPAFGEWNSFGLVEHLLTLQYIRVWVEYMFAIYIVI